MFNVRPADNQLIDFIVSVGNAFPKKDSRGNALVKRERLPGTSPLCAIQLFSRCLQHNQVSVLTERAVSRPPTELIPNSPDSTPPPSRQYADDDSRACASPATSTDAKGSSLTDTALITVHLRSHEGHEAEKPFSLHPSQMVCSLDNTCRQDASEGGYHGDREEAECQFVLRAPI